MGGSNRPNLHTLMKKYQGGSQWKTPSTLRPLHTPLASSTAIIDATRSDGACLENMSQTGVATSMGGPAPKRNNHGIVTSWTQTLPV